MAKRRRSEDEAENFEDLYGEYHAKKPAKKKAAAAPKKKASPPRATGARVKKRAPEVAEEPARRESEPGRTPRDADEAAREALSRENAFGDEAPPARVSGEEERSESRRGEGTRTRESREPRGSREPREPQESREPREERSVPRPARGEEDLDEFDDLDELDDLDLDDDEFDGDEEDSKTPEAVGFGKGLEDDEDEDEEVAAAPPQPEEPPEPQEPDNQDAIAALRELGCRVDINQRGRAWRIFFYEKHKDNAVAQVHGLPCITEVWLVGSRVSDLMAERLKESLPPTTKIYR